jgi:5-methylcytosine-specific restriction protein A
MSDIQHRDARRLLKIIREADEEKRQLTYTTAAEALGRDINHARAVAQMCDLLDAAAAYAGVPLLALVKVREASGEINREAWRGRTNRDLIIANSLRHKFAEGDYAAIESALSQLDGLGNKAAWRLVRKRVSRLELVRRLTGASDVLPDTRNPDWTRDELILALDLYLRHRDKMPGKRSPEVMALSAALGKIAAKVQGSHAPNADYRNANGVYMKLMNFRRLDPQYTEDGKVGLTRGGRGDEEVWREFANDPVRCSKVARAILDVATSDLADASVEDEEDDLQEAPEGRLLTRLHRLRERSAALSKAKKKKVLAATGALKCDVCDFDFYATYGDRGQGFIECHHTKPVETLRPDSKTRIEDLSVVCANCHRIIHRYRPWLSVAALRALLRQPGGDGDKGVMLQAGARGSTGTAMAKRVKQRPANAEHPLGRR